MRAGAGAGIALAGGPFAIVRHEFALSLTRGRTVGASRNQQEAGLRTENGEEPRSRLTRSQTKLALVAGWMCCGRGANYCLMRRLECPEGRLLTSISEPCGSAGVSGDETGSGALASKRRCVTGIKRADSANEIQYRPAKSNGVLRRSLRGLPGEIAIQRFISLRG